MSQKCFDFEDYKEFLEDWIRSQPKGGRGLSRKLADYLRIHSTMMSHILRGKQHFTEDQGLMLAEYMGLSELETDYFIELIRLGRAATPKFKQRIQKRLQALRTQSQEIKNRIEVHEKLTLEDSARFYSNWFFSAIRLLSDIPEFQNRARLVEALDLPREVAQEALTFLLEKGLCREDGSRIVLGPSRTHLPGDSPYIWTMHKNWRLKAIERHSRATPEELFYSAPMSISAQEVKKIREMILQLLAEVTQLASKSEAETLVGLNIDWFRILSTK